MQLMWTYYCSTPGMNFCVISIIIVYGIYIALYPDAQSALQHFVGDFARLLIWAQIAPTQFTILLKRIVGYTGAPRTE